MVFATISRKPSLQIYLIQVNIKVPILLGCISNSFLRPCLFHMQFGKPYESVNSTESISMLENKVISTEQSFPL